MMNSINTLRFIQQSARSISASAITLVKNHYDSLGITPKATQTDIKDAYYKLSMLYHPDKNKESDSITKFRDITEAYEVLGNITLRRLYDKGVSHIGAKTSSTYDDPVNKFYKSREYRSRPPSTGRTTIYDFDEWSRSHYGATFARDMERKRNIQFKNYVQNKEKHELKHAGMFVMITAIIAIAVLMVQEFENYDKVAYVVDDSVATNSVSKVD